MTVTATDTTTDLDQQVTDWLTTFADALNTTDPDAAADAVAALFEPDGFWRDLVVFTWNLHTAEGIDAIAELVRENNDRIGATDLSVEDATDEGDGVTRGTVTFTTPVFKARAIVRLRDGKIWTLLTSARELVARPEPKGRNRPKGVEHGRAQRNSTGRTSGHSGRNASATRTSPTS